MDSKQFVVAITWVKQEYGSTIIRLTMNAVQATSQEEALGMATKKVMAELAAEDEQGFAMSLYKTATVDLAPSHAS